MEYELLSQSEIAVACFLNVSFQLATAHIKYSSTIRDADLITLCWTACDILRSRGSLYPSSSVSAQDKPFNTVSIRSRSAQPGSPLSAGHKRPHSMLDRGFFRVVMNSVCLS